MKSKIILYSLFFIFVSVIIFVACESKPTKPEYNNVFDPGNPTTSGDPFQLQVIIGNGGVTLNWNIPDIPNLISFKIYRSAQGSTGYEELETVTGSQHQYTDQTVENGYSYWYKVSAIDGRGNETGTTNISAININTNPVLAINSGDLYTPTKAVSLTILANTAQQMMLSNNSDFIGATWETYSTTKNWTLLSGEGEKTVYLKVKYTNNNESEVVAESILPQPLNPEIVINNDDEYAPSIIVTLQLIDSSATEMYISNSWLSKTDEIQKKLDIELSKNINEIGNKKNISNNIKSTSVTTSNNLKNDGWEPYSQTKNWILSTGSGNKTVYAKFRNDFEIESEIVSDNILPQPMNPSLSIAGGAQHTATRNIELILAVSGSNLKMKLSEDSTFTGVNWQTLISPINFLLSTGAGVKTVYAKFKNDFDIESPIVSDDILPQPMNPTITIQDGEHYTPVRNVEVKINIAGSNISMKLNEDSTFAGISWQTFNTPINFNLSLQEGRKTIYGIFKNDFEIESQVINRSITLDMIPPTPLLIVTPDSGITNETTFQIDPTNSYDNTFLADSIRVRYDWENDGNWDTDWGPLININKIYSIGGGIKSIKMELVDGVGLMSDTTLNLFINTRPVADFTFSQDTSYEYLLFNFNASSSFDYENGSNIQYRWDFNGDNNWDTGWLLNDTISHLFTNYDEYSSKLAVRDIDNLIGEISVQVNTNPSILDIDGNRYKIVKIGNQWWMAENLKVAHYRNNNPIPNVTSGGTWGGLATGAYCAYDNNSSNVYTYGFLYNWFAIHDSRNIAPEGWHVPSDNEWKELEMHLGMSQSQANYWSYRGTDEGGKLKETGTLHWTSPNTGATNESEFTALPGGMRYDNYVGTFSQLSYSANFWSSTEFNTDSTFARIMDWQQAKIYRGYESKKFGYSLRCVRD